MDWSYLRSSIRRAGYLPLRIDQESLVSLRVSPLSLLILFLIIFWAILGCGFEQRHSSEFRLHPKNTNTLWIKQDALCSKKLPFCQEEFWFREDGLLEPPKELFGNGRAGLDQRLKGRLYIFTPFKTPEQAEYILPALPENMNQQTFYLWFAKNILPTVLQNPLFKNKGRVIYGKDFWSIPGIQLLHTKCHLNLYLKTIEYPFVFSFLWEDIPGKKQDFYQKIETWSMKQFTATLSADDIFPGEQI